jgi:hypothetical protein
MEQKGITAQELAQELGLKSHSIHAGDEGKNNI